MICRGCEWWGPGVARHSSHRSQAEQCLGSRLRLACQPAPHAAASRPPPTPAAGSATARHSYCQKKKARSPCAPWLQFPDYSEAGPIAACRNARKLPQIPSRQCENQQGDRWGRNRAWNCRDSLTPRSGPASPASRSRRVSSIRRDAIAHCGRDLCQTPARPRSVRLGNLEAFTCQATAPRLPRSLTVAAWTAPGSVA